MAQEQTSTTFNRYPPVFRAVQQYLRSQDAIPPDGGGLRILSFGCSNGSEMHSLRAYFPNATILGCDINPDLALGPVDGGRAGAVFQSTSEAIASHGPFDLIFAMSVLCVQPLSGPLSEVFEFSQFRMLCDMLSENLRDGGLLAIYNANYSFYDVPVSSGYRALRSPLVPSNGEVGKWSSQGVQLTERFIRNGFSVHQLQGNPEIDDELFRDCMFVKARGEPFSLGTEQSQPANLRKIQHRVLGPPLEDQSDTVAYVLNETLLEANAECYWLRRAWSRHSPAGVVSFGDHYQRATKGQLSTDMPPVDAQAGLSWPIPQASDADHRRGKFAHLAHRLLRRFSLPSS